MAIATTDNKVTYQGNGATTVWPFTFPVLEEGHLQVILTDAAGTETKLTSDYIVDLTNRRVLYPGYAEGQAPAVEDQPSPLPSTSRITLLRVVPYTQESDLGSQWPFDTVEKGLDKLTMITQQHEEILSRAVTVPVTSGTDPEAFFEDMKTQVDGAAAAAQSASAVAQNASVTAAMAVEQISYLVDGSDYITDGGTLDSDVYTDTLDGGLLSTQDENLSYPLFVSSIGTPRGVAGLDSSAKLYETNLPSSVERTGNKGVAGGYAGLDSEGMLPLRHLPDAYEKTANKNTANGYAGLDGSGAIGTAQLPGAVELITRKNKANGYAGLGADGAVSTAQLPSAVELITRKNAVNGYAGLGADGKIPSRLLPSSESRYTVVDADNTGGTDSSTAFATAYASATENQEIYVPPGKYLISTVPTGSKKVVWDCDGATAPDGSPLQLPGIVRTNYAGRLLVQQPFGGVADYAVLDVQRNVTGIGGTDGNVNTAGIFTTTTKDGIVCYEWALLGKLNNLDNSNNGDSQHTAMYGQANNYANTGRVWAGCFETRDLVQSTTSVLCGVEVDVFANGADNSANRVGLNVVTGKGVAGGAQCEVYAGMLLCPVNNDFTSGFFRYGAILRSFNRGIWLDSSGRDAEYGIYDTGNKAVGVGLLGNYTNAIRLGTGQNLAFNTEGTVKLVFDGTNINFMNGTRIVGQVDMSGSAPYFHANPS